MNKITQTKRLYIAVKMYDYPLKYRNTTLKYVEKIHYKIASTGGKDGEKLDVGKRPTFYNHFEESRV